MALKNMQHDMIMRSYEQKRLRNQNLLLQRYNEIYEQIPEFKKKWRTGIPPPQIRRRRKRRSRESSSPFFLFCS